MNGSVTVIAGAEKLVSESLVCLSVGDIRSDYGDVLNIEDSMQAFINGRAVTDTARLVAGDELTFNLPVGSKG